MSGVVFPAKSLASAAPSNSSPSGSIPMFLNSGCAAKFRTWDQLHETEAARIVVNDARAGREVERDMIVRGNFLAGASNGAPCVIGPRAFSMRKDPDMPRCMTRTSAPSRSAMRYFARRRSASTRRPVRRSAKRSGNGNRRSGRRWSTAANRAPTIAVQARGGPFRLRAVPAPLASFFWLCQLRPQLPCRSNEIEEASPSPVLVRNGKMNVCCNAKSYSSAG